MNHCKSNSPNLSGSDWSLPTVKEFRRLIPEHLFNYFNDVANEYIESLGFEDVGMDVVWTQTERTAEETAWIVGLTSGYGYWSYQDNTYRAVCSRWNN